MRQLWTIERGVEGVECATPADEAQIFALLMMMHAEMGFFSVDEAKVIEAIKLGTEQRGAITYVIKDKGQVVATLSMVFSTEWYSNDEFLAERWNFVHPDHRRSDYARKLLEQTKWTHERFKLLGRIIPIHIGINSFERTVEKIRLFARHVPCVGALFIYGELPRTVVNKKVQAEHVKIDGWNRERSHRTRAHVPDPPAIREVIRASRNAGR